jgi:hypothetical protein
MNLVVSYRRNLHISLTMKYHILCLLNCDIIQLYSVKCFSFFSLSEKLEGADQLSIFWVWYLDAFGMGETVIDFLSQVLLWNKAWLCSKLVEESLACNLIAIGCFCLCHGFCVIS